MSARSGELLCAAALALHAEPRRRRAAMFLARQALEEAIRARVGQVQARPPRAMRTCLLLLKSGLVTDLPAGTTMRARRTWHSLSARCHHQPYELVPTAEECAEEIAAAAALVRVLWPR